MRIAFVCIPRFACAVEVHRNPLLARRSLIIGDAEQPKRVLDRSGTASQLGVRYGMTTRKALGLCPDAVILAPDPVLYRNRWESILRALDEVVPEVEDNEMGRAYLNVTGLQRHYRDEADLAGRILQAVATSGLAACVGIGDGKFLALAAATEVDPGNANVVPARGEARFLAPLTVEMLPFGPEVTSRLRLLGLETIGDVAELSVPELQSQFGFDGKRLWHLANGLDDEPLRPRPRSEALSSGLTFEAPVAGIDVLIAGSKQLLSRLRPSLRGRAARELTLQAELTSGRSWERRLVMREAVSEDARLVFVLKSALTNFPPPQAVRSLTLKLEGLTGETGRQLALGERARQERQVHEAVRQLKARYGYSPIYHCVDMEPWSVVPEERQILVESDA